MRELFGFLSIFDWITPSIGFLEDAINDPTLLQSNSWTFFIPYDESINNGWNAVTIEELLHQHGVKHWGSQITNGEFFFSVKLEQAQWAEYVLNQYGIPLAELSQGAPRPKPKADHSARSVRQVSGKSSIVSFLDKLLGRDVPPFWP